MVRWSVYPEITTCKKEYTTREPKTETHFNQIHYPCTHFVDHMVMATENTKERSIGLPTTLIAATTATTTAQASASLCLLIYMDLTTVEAPFSFLISLSLSLSQPSLSLLTSHHGSICTATTANVSGFYLFPFTQINPQFSQSNLNLTLYHLFWFSPNTRLLLCLSHGFPKSVIEEIFRCYGGLGYQRLVVWMGFWLKEIVIKLKKKKIRIGTKLVKKRKLFKIKNWCGVFLPFKHWCSH